MVNGRAYRLTVVSYRLGMVFTVSNLSTGAWLINGRRMADVSLPPKPTDLPAGRLHPELRLLWLEMPVPERLELLAGVLQLSIKDTPAQQRQKLLDAGYVPLSVAVKSIPTITTASADALQKAMARLAKTQSPGTSSQPAQP